MKVYSKFLYSFRSQIALTLKSFSYSIKETGSRSLQVKHRANEFLSKDFLFTRTIVADVFDANRSTPTWPGNSDQEAVPIIEQG
jgi:hypothetical protein